MEEGAEYLGFTGTMSDEQAKAFLERVGHRGSASFNRLTFAQEERLMLLAEEAGEVVKACMKILRHGYESRHPDGGPTNRSMLEKELGHLANAVDMLDTAKDVKIKNVFKHRDEKAAEIHKYLHYQGEKK